MYGFIKKWYRNKVIGIIITVFNQAYCSFQGGSDLEVEDSSVALWKALLWGNHSVQKLLIQSEAGDGSQQPTVTWTQKMTHDYGFYKSYSAPKCDFIICSSAVQTVRKKNKPLFPIFTKPASIKNMCFWQ